MNKIRTAFLFFLAALVLLCSCFHKSDKTGTADDIKHSMICHTPTGDYLITHEEIFHATSKSSGPKGNFTSGYTNYRYTIRNVSTGEQIARVITGDRTEDLSPLGFDGSLLWCYSADKKVGLHAREPGSFGVKISQKDIEKANPTLAGNFNAPNIYETDRYYSYNPMNNRVMATDLQGNIFSIDPISLKATLLKEKPDGEKFRSSNAHTNSVHRTGYKTIRMQGDPRKQIIFESGKKSEESYLEGEILLEQDAGRLSDVAAALLKEYEGELAQLKQRADSFLRLYPQLANTHDAYLAIRDANIPNRYYELKNELERAVRDSSRKRNDITRNLDDMALGLDTNTLYIIHAANLTDTSSLLITKTTIGDNASVPQWTTTIPGIYFDPSKGIKRNASAEVFKSGNPQFRYEWYGIEGGVLVGIKMLFAFGINIKTGKLLWKQQL